MYTRCDGNAGAPKGRPANRTGLSGVGKFLKWVVLVAVMAIGGGGTGPAMADPARLVVRNDPGGSLQDRLRALSGLRQSGTRVEIRGGYCMSACTMYLGLPNTCVSPNAVLGFHGPSSRYYGIALPPDKFEYWSQVMASHYPAPLRQWYLREGRRIIVGFHEIRGRELIRMGVPRCA